MPYGWARHLQICNCPTTGAIDHFPLLYIFSKMNRNHIHCAPGEPGEDGVISGMRRTCQVYVYIDLQAALAGSQQYPVAARQDNPKKLQSWKFGFAVLRYS